MEIMKAVKPTALAVVGALSASSAAPSPVPRAVIAARIRADVAEMVAGINAKDVSRATAYGAPDLVSMESLRAPSFGAAANRQGLTMVFKYAPSWRLTLIDETVDVADAGDLAVYRSTYAEDSINDGTPMTHKVNYLAGFRRGRDGAWRIHWSVVCAQERSHKK